MKAFSLLFPFALLLGACAFGGPKAVSDYSREEAIRLYNGGIAEAEWLAKLNVERRAQSVKLADGFIFYKTETRDSAEWVTEIALPVDAPAELKTLARSFRSQAEATKEICLSGDALWLDGTIVSEEQLAAEAKRLQAFPRSRRPHCRLVVEKGVDAEKQSRVRNLLKKSGIVIEE